MKVTFEDIPDTDHFDVIEKFVDSEYRLTQVGRAVIVCHDLLQLVWLSLLSFSIIAGQKRQHTSS